MNDKEVPAGGTCPAGDRSIRNSDTILSASERYNHFRPIMPDGKAIRITADGLVYDTIRDSDEYVEMSMQFTNGCPIYLTKGRTPEEDFAIEEYFVSSGILVYQYRLMKMRMMCDPAGVTERLARLPKGGDLEELAIRFARKAAWFKDEAQRCKTEIKKAKRRHASAEAIEEIRHAARLHIRVSKEYHTALRLIQTIVEAVAKARHGTETTLRRTITTFRRTITRDISLRETRCARAAATQAHITISTRLTAEATQRGATAPPPSCKISISVFSAHTRAVA